MLLKRLKIEFLGSFLITLFTGVGGFNVEMSIH